MAYKVTTNPVYTQDFADGLLSAAEGAVTVAVVNTPEVHLRTDNKIPTPLSQASDFTEAAFTGYGAATLTLTALPKLNVADDVRGIQADATFVAGAVTAPVTCTGYWVDNGASTPAVTYMAENFADPVVLSSAGDFISLDVIIAIHEAFATQE